MDIAQTTQKIPTDLLRLTLLVLLFTFSAPVFANGFKDYSPECLASTVNIQVPDDLQYQQFDGFKLGFWRHYCEDGKSIVMEHLLIQDTANKVTHKIDTLIQNNISKDGAFHRVASKEHMDVWGDGFPNISQSTGLTVYSGGADAIFAIYENFNIDQPNAYSSAWEFDYENRFQLSLHTTTASNTYTHDFHIPANKYFDTFFQARSSHTGSWISTGRSGEGFLFEIADSGNEQYLVVYWFTYDQDGNQVWLTGAGQITDTKTGISLNLYQTQGTQFGDQFDASMVQINQVGNATIRFLDCSNAQISYNTQLGNAQFDISKILHTLNRLPCKPTFVSTTRKTTTIDACSFTTYPDESTDSFADDILSHHFSDGSIPLNNTFMRVMRKQCKESDHIVFSGYVASSDPFCPSHYSIEQSGTKQDSSVAYFINGETELQRGSCTLLGLDTYIELKPLNNLFKTNLAVSIRSTNNDTLYLPSTTTSQGSNPHIYGAYSGSWFNPDRNGEGFLVEIAERNFNDIIPIIYWFTYDQEGKQMWLVGAVEEAIDPMSNSFTVKTWRTHGAKFGDAFKPEDVVREQWGELTVTFDNCENGTVEYTTPYGNGYTKIQRVVGPLAGEPCRLQ